jgi:hypothetical protein
MNKTLRYAIYAVIIAFCILAALYKRLGIADIWPGILFFVLLIIASEFFTWYSTKDK